MARQSWVQVDGKLIPKEQYVPRRRERAGPYIMPDITPFRTVCGDIAGQEIGSRSQLREFEKRNGVVQIGSDTSIFRRDTKAEEKRHREQIGRDLRRTWGEMTS